MSMLFGCMRPLACCRQFRAPNGYRQYTARHLEQARRAHLSLRWPYLNDKAILSDLVKSAANANLEMAMELAYKYLAHVRVERTFAESAVEFLERWAAGQLMDSSSACICAKPRCI